MYDACVPWPERPKGAKDKSRGPKGLELEVGARRAPKLLVHYKYNQHCSISHQCNASHFQLTARLANGWHGANAL